MDNRQGIKEVWNALRVAQEKYTYFMLAISASAIAFSVQKTELSIFDWSLFPVGVAVILWGASFYCGCRCLIWISATLGANYSLLQLSNRTHSMQPPEGEPLEAAYQGSERAMRQNSQQAGRYSIWQFRLIIAGAVAFLIWHVLEIVARTTAS